MNISRNIAIICSYHSSVSSCFIRKASKNSFVLSSKRPNLLCGRYSFDHVQVLGSSQKTFLSGDPSKMPVKCQSYKFLTRLIVEVRVIC